MRISVYKNSPFYDEPKLDLHPQILLDGNPVYGCFEASEEDGWADVWVRDSNGKLMLNATKDEAQKQRLYGKVKIIFCVQHQ